MKKQRFAAVFKQAWEKATTLETSIKAFRDSGIFPMNPTRVLSTLKMEPSRVFDQSSPSVPVDSASPVAPNEPACDNIDTNLTKPSSTTADESSDVASIPESNPSTQEPITMSDKNGASLDVETAALSGESN